MTTSYIYRKSLFAGPLQVGLIFAVIAVGAGAYACGFWDTNHSVVRRCLVGGVGVLFGGFGIAVAIYNGTRRIIISESLVIVRCEMGKGEVPWDTITEIVEELPAAPEPPKPMVSGPRSFILAKPVLEVLRRSVTLRLRDNTEMTIERECVDQWDSLLAHLAKEAASRGIPYRQKKKRLTAEGIDKSLAESGL